MRERKEEWREDGRNRAFLLRIAAMAKTQLQVLQVAGLKIAYPRGDAACVRAMVAAAGRGGGHVEAATMQEILPLLAQHHRKMSLAQALEVIGARLVK